MHTDRLWNAQQTRIQALGKARAMQGSCGLVGKCCLLLLLFCLSAGAAVRVPALFADGMVVQREMRIPVWGWATPGERVSVTLGERQANAITNPDGAWMVRLEPLPAGGPHTLTVSGSNTITIRDVLVGEVWVCSGQSWMGWEVNRVRDAQQETANANFPQIRMFNTRIATSPTPLRDCEGKWAVCSPQTVGAFSGCGYFFARDLHQKLKVPVGMIHSSVPGTVAQAWTDRESFKDSPTLSMEMGDPDNWCYGSNPQNKAMVLYNGMIAPLIPYGIKGVIWFQGTGGEPLKAMIRGWRRNWGQGDPSTGSGQAFPFLFVQLPNYNGGSNAPQGTDLAAIREAQATALALPNTAMAVTIDIGDPTDLHPINMQDFGQRLALIAEGTVYGQNVVYSGPVYDHLAAEGAGLRLHFRSQDGKLAVRGNGPVEGFFLAGPNERYVPANAAIDGLTVVVSHPSVLKPTYVRYAWMNSPVCNLCNGAGLPARPFRAYVPGDGRAYALDRITHAFTNPGFEESDPNTTNAAGWVPANGAMRTDEKASAGRWSMRLSGPAAVAQNGIVPVSPAPYDWNSDLLEPNRLRPGMVAGYAFDAACGDEAAPATAYMRLCADASATAIEYWGGVPQIKVARREFTRCQVAVRMTPSLALNGIGMGIGCYFAQSGPKNAVLYLDNLSDIDILRPKLGISATAPIDLGRVKAGETATSAPRSFFNSQPDTLTDQREPGRPGQPVPTVLYGIARMQPSLQWKQLHLWGETDHVGAVIQGPDAVRFAFVSEHASTNGLELKLIGADGQGGLKGGPEPERESWQLQFLGAQRPGAYGAVIRVVTQAGNVGTLSQGQTGEPPEHLWYVDIPVIAHVENAGKVP